VHYWIDFYVKMLYVLGRRRHRWVDNIKIDLGDIGLGGGGGAAFTGLV
jgi:hypothetical protein